MMSNEVRARMIDEQRSLTQDAAYGFRMLVDIALQALSPAVNAPTTAHQVIYRLTNLLAMISQRPQPTGLCVDENHQVRLLPPVYSWEAYVKLAFSEIIHYGGERSLRCRTSRVNRKQSAMSLRTAGAKR